MRAVLAQHLGRRADAGRIHDAVQSAERGDRRLNGGLHLRFARHVGLHERGAESERLRGRRAHVGIDVDQDGVTAGRDDGFSRGATESRGAASREERLAVDTHASSPSEAAPQVAPHPSEYQP